MAAFSAAEAHTDVGISMDGLIKRLTGRFTPQEIMSTVEVLINDAQIYSTIDDRHFKSTNF